MEVLKPVDQLAAGDQVFVEHERQWRSHGQSLSARTELQKNLSNTNPAKQNMLKSIEPDGDGADLFQS
jgi:hypothetical protein